MRHLARREFAGRLDHAADHALCRDQRFRHVAVNREELAIGLCSGAFFSGIGAFALMGASGFLTCIYAITKINYTYQIPLLIGITLRGRPAMPRNSISRTGSISSR